jgi:response regulator RpfG family c-di-GMP phosphodiesterase
MVSRARELEILVRGAELHDVGSVAIPEVIPEKPAPLDPSERATVERHCEVGERVLAAAQAIASVARLVRISHERFDGRGHRDRRRGSDIAHGAHIIAVREPSRGESFPARDGA